MSRHFNIFNRDIYLLYTIIWIEGIIFIFTNRIIWNADDSICFIWKLRCHCEGIWFTTFTLKYISFGSNSYKYLFYFFILLFLYKFYSINKSSLNTSSSYSIYFTTKASRWWSECRRTNIVAILWIIIIKCC